MTIDKNPTQMTLSTSSEPALLDALRINLNLLGELAMRYEIETQPKRPNAEVPTISCPDDVRRVLGPEMAALAQEQLRVLLLDTKGRLVGQRVIYQGNVNSSQVRAAEVFRPAVVEAVPTVIIAHNHPSGDPTPSPNDVSVTRRLAQAGKLLDVEVFDHVVIGREGVVSLKGRGLM